MSFTRAARRRAEREQRKAPRPQPAPGAGRRTAKMRITNPPLAGRYATRRRIARINGL